MRKLFSRKYAGALTLLGVGIAVAIALVIIAPWASSNPDSLEKVAIDKGFDRTAQEGVGPMKDYSVPGVKAQATSTRLSGLIGVVIVLACAMGLGYAVVLLGRRKRSGALEGAVLAGGVPEGPPDET